MPFPRSSASPEKKYHPGSGLNQRDQAALGYARASHPAKPTKIFYCRGCAPARPIVASPMLAIASLKIKLHYWPTTEGGVTHHPPSETVANKSRRPRQTGKSARSAGIGSRGQRGNRGSGSKKQPPPPPPPPPQITAGGGISHLQLEEWLFLLKPSALTPGSPERARL